MERPVFIFLTFDFYFEVYVSNGNSVIERFSVEQPEGKPRQLSQVHGVTGASTDESPFE
jgi:hypothetical protein